MDASKVFINIGISVHLLYDIVIEMDFKQDDEETHFMTTDEGAKYLVFVSSRSVKMRGSLAFSVCIFLRKVCLFFNF